jgi:predicted naringenin-chalcone synthase
MTVFLSGFSTAVPGHRYEQSYIRDIVKSQFAHDALAQRLVHRLYSMSGISHRHSCIGRTEEGILDPEFFPVGADGTYLSKSTGFRNRRYKDAARPLFREAAEKSLENAGISNESITHVITVSCTGFYAPGPEFHLVKDLGLKPETQRFHLGFMGCFAFFPALKLASQLVSANAGACVLIVCLELCSLHIQFKPDQDVLLSGCVFADGAGACIVSGEKPDVAHFELKAQHGHIAPEGESDMAWTIGDSGFDMVLSSYIPAIIGSNIAAIVDKTLEQATTSRDNIKYWAIHPGGRAILDKAEQSLGLEPEDLSVSRAVLDANGNMSSATILFVLKAFLEQKKEGGDVYAMAFGPGLTIESALLKLSPDG